MVTKAAIIEFAGSSLQQRPTMHKLVLIRHGESTWNLENRFTGWTDVDLTPTGVAQAQEAAGCSRRRASSSTSPTPRCSSARSGRCGTALDQMDRTWLPVVNDWRLNERHYGALQGLNKAETAKPVRRRAGAGLAPQLRHAAAGAGRPRPAQRARDPRYAGLAPEQVPLTECLKDTVARVLPCWNEVLAPAIRSRPAAGDRRARQQHARAGQVPRRHQRRRHRRPEHPERHAAGLRARRRSEADPQLLPRRRHHRMHGARCRATRCGWRPAACRPPARALDRSSMPITPQHRRRPPAGCVRGAAASSAETKRTRHHRHAVQHVQRRSAAAPRGAQAARIRRPASAS
jgi:2,3-bisphosphoglycerate-dependent phosphoglycerate mutase